LGERIRIAVSMTLVVLAAAGCNASIGGDGGESESADADGGAGDAEDAAPRLGDTTDGGVTVNDQPPCEATADATAQDHETGTCYYYVGAAPLAWSAAQDACVALGGHLAFIESADESVLVGTITPGDAAAVEAGLQDVWVGGTDAPTEGDWHWIGGPSYYDDVGAEALGYINWRGVEPNNSTGQNPDGENCMVIEGDNDLVDRGPQWDDRSCLAAFPYLCEVDAP
jgi:hypothetical protein